MKKSFPILSIALSALLILAACNDSVPNAVETEAASDALIAPDETYGEAMNEPNTETEQQEMLAFYLAKFRSYRQLQGTRLNGTSDLVEKHHFEHLEDWYSIDVNDDGVTYTAVFEVNLADTITHFISIQPEIYMEGGYVNYYSEPGFEYYFESNRLARTVYLDPQNEAAENPSGKLDEDELHFLGDSLKQRVKSYFRLDTSRADFNGIWEYPLSNLAYSFDIELRQIESFVYGSYCAQTQPKYDCGSVEQRGEPCHLNGYILADTLHLEFTSCLTRRAGRAKLYFENDTLIWNTKYNPQEGLVPNQVDLIRRASGDAAEL